MCACCKLSANEQSQIPVLAKPKASRVTVKMFPETLKAVKLREICHPLDHRAGGRTGRIGWAVYSNHLKTSDAGKATTQQLGTEFSVWQCFSSRRSRVQTRDTSEAGQVGAPRASEWQLRHSGLTGLHENFIMYKLGHRLTSSQMVWPRTSRNTFTVHRAQYLYTVRTRRLARYAHTLYG